MSMRVNEIFVSVQGEGTRTGELCTFVRFTGCNLRCTYCDTEYAFYEGETRERSELLEEVRATGTSLICVTGGEPVLQPELTSFLEELVEMNRTVLLETGGSLPLGEVPPAVIKIVDIKTPGAMQRHPDEDYQTSEAFVSVHFCYENLDVLEPHDEVKFVVTSRADYEWARDFSREHGLSNRVCAVLLSPSHGEVDPRELVDWMREDQLDARLNLQIHKYIWDADTRGV